MARQERSQEEWLQLVRHYVGLDRGLGLDEDYDHLVHHFARYGADVDPELALVGQALDWLESSQRLSGLVYGWVRLQHGEELAELLAGLLAGFDRSRQYAGVRDYCWHQWQPQAREFYGA